MKTRDVVLFSEAVGAGEQVGPFPAPTWIVIAPGSNEYPFLVDVVGEQDTSVRRRYIYGPTPWRVDAGASIRPTVAALVTAATSREALSEGVPAAGPGAGWVQLCNFPSVYRTVSDESSEAVILAPFAPGGSAVREAFDSVPTIPLEAEFGKCEKFLASVRWQRSDGAVTLRYKSFDAGQWLDGVVVRTSATDAVALTIAPEAQKNLGDVRYVTTPLLLHHQLYLMVDTPGEFEVRWRLYGWRP